MQTLRRLPTPFDDRPYNYWSGQLVGFDSLRKMVDSFLEDTGTVHGTGYPPYNIIHQDDNNISIELAVAGFKEEDITVTLENRLLKVEGKRATEKHEGDTPIYVYKGIAERSFERRFVLAEYIEVKEAKLENGMLYINLEQIIPEEKKPKTIEIKKTQ